VRPQVDCPPFISVEEFPPLSWPAIFLKSTHVALRMKFLPLSVAIVIPLSVQEVLHEREVRRFRLFLLLLLSLLKSRGFVVFFVP